MSGNRPAFQGGLDNKGATNAIVSGSSIDELHTTDPAVRVNIVSAIFPKVFRQYAVITAGQMKT